MMMNPASLEAESVVVRVYAPQQRGSMLHREPQEQARKAFAARARKRDQRNVKTCVAFEAKALGRDGVEIPAGLVAMTATIQKWPSYRRIVLLRSSMQFGSYGAPRSAVM